MIKLDNIIHKDCEVCGTMFRTTHKGHKYCSDECRKASIKETPYMIHAEDIFMRDDYRCVYCGKSSIEDGVKLHLDHVYPISKNGDGDLRNLVTSCQKCNVHKNNKVLPYDIIKRIWARNEKLNKMFDKMTYKEMVNVFEDNIKQRLK